MYVRKWFRPGEDNKGEIFGETVFYFFECFVGKATVTNESASEHYNDM